MHRRALGLALLVELRRRHRCSVNSVASGCGTNVKHRIARAARLRAHHLALADQPQAERVDQDVGVVGRVEHHFARDRRHAHAVAVAADSADYAAEQIARAGMLEGAELERVHARHGPRAHRENIAQDSADSGRRALVGLDERRMVVAFDFEDRRPSVADVDCAGVLARPLHHEFALRWQLPQMTARRFVGAMLRPHHGEHAELGVSRGAADDLFDLAVLIGRESVRAGQLEIDLRLAGDRHGTLAHRALPAID